MWVYCADTRTALRFGTQQAVDLQYMGNKNQRKMPTIQVQGRLFFLSASKSFCTLSSKKSPHRPADLCGTHDLTFFSFFHLNRATGY